MIHAMCADIPACHDACTGNGANGCGDTGIGEVHAPPDQTVQVFGFELRDQRLFGAAQLIPSLVIGNQNDEVRAFVAERRPDWTVEVATDCIRIAPPM